MKRNLSIIGTFALAILFLSSFSLRENPQDPPRGKKGEKHIKIVKVDKDHKKMELDTIIEGENVFVWNGDTIGGGHEMEWISKEGIDMDFDMDFDVDVKETADGKVIILKSGKEGSPMLHEIHEYKMDGDSGKAYKIKIITDGKPGNHDMMMFHGDEGDNKMIFRAPDISGMPHPPKLLMMRKQGSGNVIDLSDPGIISYDKKMLKNGTEKITIIRNKPIEKDIDLEEEIIMHGAGTNHMMIHEGYPGETKTIKVIKSDDGNVEIIEDGKVMIIKEVDKENGKFITDDGKVIYLKEMKEGDEKKLEIIVEEEIKKEEK